MTGRPGPDTLTTERLMLCPLSAPEAARILAGDLSGLSCWPGWPHADTPDALAPLALATEPTPGTWLIRLREDAGPGRVIGDCGIVAGPDAAGDAAIGYGLAPSARRRGYGTEAVTALTEWVLDQPGVRRVTAEVRVDNVASRRLLERVGFALASVQRPWVHYAVTKPHQPQSQGAGCSATT